MPGRQRPFLTAAWRNLVMLSFEIDPEVLIPQVPRGLSLDQWDGKCLISIIGLQFLGIRIRGIPLPFYGSYPEINLRFYVRREMPGKSRRGVVFIKQIVPHQLVALVARRLYREGFIALPMKHSVEFSTSGQHPSQVSYRWRHSGMWGRLRVGGLAPLNLPHPGSVEEFVTERYWGYSSQPDGSTREYRVRRPHWRIRKAADSDLECDVGQLYGGRFVPSLTGPAVSAFWAEGSTVSLQSAVKLPDKLPDNLQ